MISENTNKAFYIQAYFNDLQQRTAFLAELHSKGRKDEALMLCCCYIEALGNRESSDLDLKAKNYCTILSDKGGNEIWRQIHPKQIKNVLFKNKFFKEQLSTLETQIDYFGSQLIEPQVLLAQLDPHINVKQRSWFQDHIFKGSMANISYERIRCELVHDITGGSISFSETAYKGNPVPDIDFETLYASLNTILAISQSEAISTNSW